MDSGSDWDSLTGDDQLSISSTKQSVVNKEDNEYIKDVNGGFKSVELEDESDVHERIFENHQQQQQQQQQQPRLSDGETLLPFTQFQVGGSNSPVKKIKGKFANKQHKKYKQYEENTGNAKPTTWSNVGNTEEEDSQRFSYLKNSNQTMLNNSQHNENHETINSLPNQSPQFGNNQYHGGFEYWNGPSSIAMMPVNKSSEGEENVDDMENVQKFFYEKCFYNGHTIKLEKPPHRMSKYATRIRPYLQRVWSEFFGGIQIIIEFFVIIILELSKVVFSTVSQKLIAGLMAVIGDHLLKPLYSSFFNFLLQPTFVLLWNITNGTRKFMQPLVLLLGDFLVPLSNLVRAFRIFDTTPAGHNNNKACQKQLNTKTV